MQFQRRSGVHDHVLHGFSAALVFWVTNYISNANSAESHSKFYMSAYEHAITHCSWKTQRRVAYSRSAFYVKDFEYNSSKMYSCESSLYSQTLIIRRVQGISSFGAMRFLRYGTNISVAKGFVTAALIAPFGGHCGASSLQRCGSVLGNPPVHIHHAYIARLNDYAGFIDAFAEDECHSMHGGLNCLWQIMPEGFGFPVSEDLLAFAVFVDVRPFGVQMEIGAEFAIRWTPEPLRRLTKYYFSNASPRNIPGFYRIPAHEPSIFWYSGMLPSSGNALFVDFHTHLHATSADSASLFLAHPRALGLNAGIFEMYGTSPFLPFRFNLSLIDVKHHIMQSLKTSQLKCGPGACLQKPRLWCNTQDIGVEFVDRIESLTGLYDRRISSNCHTSRYEVGENFTVVGFNHRTTSNQPYDRQQYKLYSGGSANSLAMHWQVKMWGSDDYAYDEEVAIVGWRRPEDAVPFPAKFAEVARSINKFLAVVNDFTCATVMCHLRGGEEEEEGR